MIEIQISELERILSAQREEEKAVRSEVQLLRAQLQQTKRVKQEQQEKICVLESEVNALQKKIDELDVPLREVTQSLNALPAVTKLNRADGGS